LSQAQSLATTGVLSATDPIGSRTASSTVTIQFGTLFSDPIDGGTYPLATPDAATGKYTGATFKANAVPAVAAQFTIAAGSTLTEIAKKINETADLGVTASIVNDGGAAPNRLVLTSTKTGETSSMKITVDGAADALSRLLSNDPTGAPADQLQQTVTAQNTKLSVNGIAITSASSTVAGAIQDTTLSVSKIGTTTLSVKQDTDSVKSAVTAFVNAYNNLQSIAKKLTAFDASSKSGAVLLGDSTLRNIQVGIRSALTSVQAGDGDGGGSGLTMLSQIGVTFEKDGTLAIDSTTSQVANPIKLATVMSSNMSGVAKLFSGSGGVGGYGTQLSSLLTSYTSSTSGTLTAATKGINTTLDLLGKQYTATSERAEATVARYKAQFTQLDVMISRMNQTSTYLTAQFEALNNSNNK
jgi:flagellar hook-associated protein 2